MDLYEPERLDDVVLYRDGETTGILADSKLFLTVFNTYPYCKYVLVYSSLTLILDGGRFLCMISSNTLWLVAFLDFQNYEKNLR